MNRADLAGACIAVNKETTREEQAATSPAPTDPVLILYIGLTVFGREHLPNSVISPSPTLTILK